MGLHIGRGAVRSLRLFPLPRHDRRTDCVDVAQIRSAVPQKAGVPVGQSVPSGAGTGRTKAKINAQAGLDTVLAYGLRHISGMQMEYITNVAAGCGLTRCAGNIVPLENSFPRNTRLYQLMITKPDEALRTE